MKNTEEIEEQSNLDVIFFGKPQFVPPAFNAERAQHEGQKIIRGEGGGLVRGGRRGGGCRTAATDVDGVLPYKVAPLRRGRPEAPEDLPSHCRVRRREGDVQHRARRGGIGGTAVRTPGPSDPGTAADDGSS